MYLITLFTPRLLSDLRLPWRCPLAMPISRVLFLRILTRKLSFPCDAALITPPSPKPKAPFTPPPSITPSTLDARETTSLKATRYGPQSHILTIPYTSCR
jgi:hypothetical protein